MTSTQEFPSPHALLLHTGLYSPITLDASHTVDLIRFKYYTGSFDADCPYCGKPSTFRAKSKFTRTGPPLLNVPNQGLSHEGTVSIALKRANDVDDVISTIKELAGEIAYNIEYDVLVQGEVEDYEGKCLNLLGYGSEFFDLDFECSRTPDHKVHFVFRAKDHTLTKIGQSPSFADLTSEGTSTFIKILDSPKQREYTRAVGLFSHGIGIGAFVYLRRVLENLIEEAHAKARETEGWDEPDYENARTYSEKIKLLKGHLPTFMVDNASLYSILSKGIHELGEEECHDLFPVMKQGIDLILIEEHRRREEENVREDTNRDLNRLLSKYGQSD